MATKINDTITFPVTTPSDNDLILGTDVSNTSNDPGGQTVNFRVSDVRGDLPPLSFGIEKIPDVFIGRESRGSGDVVFNLSDYPDMASVAQFQALVYLRNTTSGNATVRLSLSSNNGSSYASSRPLFTSSEGASEVVQVFVDLTAGRVQVWRESNNPPLFTTISTQSGPTNAMKFWSNEGYSELTVQAFAMSGRG